MRHEISGQIFTVKEGEGFYPIGNGKFLFKLIEIFGPDKAKVEYDSSITGEDDGNYTCFFRMAGEIKWFELRERSSHIGVSYYLGIDFEDGKFPENGGNTGIDKEGKLLVSNWIMTYAELGGAKLPETDYKDNSISLYSGYYTYQKNDGSYKLILPADSRGVAGMDLISERGSNKGKTLFAIFEMSGDTLKICYDLDGEKRPERFATQPGSRQFFAIFKRDNPFIKQK